MAVEIPVVVNIDAAFADAAKRVPRALEPLRRSITELTDDLSFWREQMQAANIDSKDFALAAKEFQNVSQALEVANDKLLKFTSNDKSIKQMNVDLASLNRRWEEMGAAQKFTSAGKLSDEAKDLRAQYKQITAEIQKAGKSLSQMEAEEQRLLAISKQGQQSRKYENAILNSTVKTMRVLQEQERILTARIQTAPVGSSKFQQLSARLVEVRKEMAAADAQIRRGGAAFRDLGTNAAKATTRINTTTTALSTQGGVLQRLSGYLSGYALLFAGVRFVRNVRETTAELELQRVALGGILNDTERATELFRQIKAAALKSPFEIKDLVTYTKQLAAYRIETDKLFDVTMKLADVSAGLGVDMNRLILAYGQVRAASVLRGQELRQFTEAGIPLVDKLAEKFRELGREGTTTADVFDLISKRAVPFSMIEEIFDDMTKAGGVFYKMQEKQSETLKGQWMKLRDSITIMYDEIGNTEVVHKAMSSFISTANNLARSWKEVANWLKTLTTVIITYNVVAKASALATNSITKAEAARLAVTKAQTIAMPKFIASILGETAAKKASAWMSKRLEIAQYKLATATTLTGKAFWKLYATLMSNPYAAAAAAVAALGFGIYTLVKNSKEATISIDELERSIAKYENASQKASDTDKLIEAYEELSTKADKSTSEQERLNRITKELSNTFPSAVSGINQESGALQINIEKVKQLTKAEKELELIRLNKDRERAEQRVAELEGMKSYLLGQYEAGGKWKEGPVLPGGGSTEREFVPFSEDDLEKMGKRISEINEELDPLKSKLEYIHELEEGIKDEGGETTKTFKGWKQALSKIQEEKVNAGASTIFSDSDIENMGTIQDLWKKVKSGIKETETELEGLKSLQKTLADDKKEENEADIKLTEKQLDLYKAIKEAFGFVFSKGGSGGGYKQDPFINRMQERIKFMQDFKKGYDDLNKYVSSSDALADISKKMEARGLALNISVDEQKSAAEGISEWYEKQMEDAFAAAKKHGAVGKNYMEFLRQTISDTTNKGKALKDFQKLIQSLFDAKTDYDTSVLKKNLEDSLQKVKNDIKRSETARNFYQDILDMTGDEELATTMSVSVYGGIGDDFKTRMQKQLSDAMKSLDASDLTDKMKEAFEKKDFDYILANLDKFPEKYRDVLKELADADEKYNADLVKNLLKSLEAAKTYGEKRVELAKQTAQRMAQIEELNAPESVKQQMREQNARKEAEEAAKLAFEAFKDTPMYVELFANLDRASTKMLRNMRTNLLSLKGQWKNLDPKDLKELQSRLDEIDKQLATKNPFKALVDSIKEYRTLTKQKSRKEAEEEAEVATKNAALQGDLLEAAVQEYETAKKTYGVKSQEYALAKDALSVQQQEKDEADEAAKKAQKAANAYRQAAQHISDAAEGLQEWAGYVKTSLDGVGKIIDTFGSDKTSEKFGIISTGISDTLSGAAKIASGAAKGLAGIPDVIAGVADVISGTFGAVKKWKIEELNDRIEEQERMLKELEYSYGRLDKVMGESFGSDYIYNYTKQLEVLQAKVDAYNEQAELERKKGKKADVDKIKDYEDAARDATDQIADMKHQLSEFFTGTDITSAAEDFANAWIEAYKEFGSTTDAMSEKFNDMIESMINKSLAAKIMQEMLQPVFDQIDEMSKDGLLGTEEIASIAALAQERIPLINDAMTNLMSSLASAGLDVRTSTAGFKGISKDIAGASEESILGLAAGINTQNFYMSFVPTISENVAAILSAMTGSGTAPNMSPSMSSTGEGEVMPSVQQMVYDHLPIMDQNISEMLKLFKSVITTKNSSTNTNYIAVR